MKETTNNMSGKGHDTYIAREFDRAAGGYEESRLVKSYQRRVQTLVINRIPIEKGMTVLDLGCGTGQGTIDIASRLDGTGKIVGMDLSEKMIEQAKKKVTDLRYDSVEFVTGSAGSLEYRNYFDCIFTTNAFHHFDDKEAIFRKIWEALKSEGVFIVQDICDDYFLMKMVDFLGKIGEKAHIGSTKSVTLNSTGSGE
jgi:ubiquinone/menaquinone biosynthesis C-methylase UbiE